MGIAQLSNPALSIPIGFTYHFWSSWGAGGWRTRTRRKCMIFGNRRDCVCVCFVAVLVPSAGGISPQPPRRDRHHVHDAAPHAEDFGGLDQQNSPAESQGILQLNIHQVCLEHSHLLLRNPLRNLCLRYLQLHHGTHGTRSTQRTPL